MVTFSSRTCIYFIRKYAKFLTVTVSYAHRSKDGLFRKEVAKSFVPLQPKHTIFCAGYKDTERFNQILTVACC